MDNMKKILSETFDNEKIEEGFLDYFVPNGRTIRDVRMANVVSKDIGKIAKQEIDILTKLRNIIQKEDDFVEKNGKIAKSKSGGKRYANNAVDSLMNKSKSYNDLLTRIIDDRLEEVQDIVNDAETIQTKDDEDREKISAKSEDEEGETTQDSEEEVTNTNEEPDWIDNTIKQTIDSEESVEIDDVKGAIKKFSEDENKITELSNELVTKVWKGDDRKPGELRGITKKVIKLTLGKYIESNLDSMKALKSAKQEVMDHISQNAREKGQGKKIPKKLNQYKKIIDNTVMTIQSLISKKLEDISKKDIESENPEQISESIHNIFFIKTKFDLVETFEQNKKFLFRLIENNQKERGNLAKNIEIFGKSKSKLISNLVSLYSKSIKTLEKYLSKAKENGTIKTLQKEIEKLEKKLQNLEKLKNKTLEIVKTVEKTKDDAGDKGESEVSEEEFIKNLNDKVKQELGIDFEDSTHQEMVDKSAQKQTELPKEVSEFIDKKVPKSISISPDMITKLRNLHNKETINETKLQKKLKESFWKNEIKEDEDKKDWGIPKKSKLFVWLPPTNEKVPTSEIENSIKDSLGASDTQREGNKINFIKKRKIIKTFDSENEMRDYYNNENNETDYEVGFIKSIDWPSKTATVSLYTTTGNNKYARSNKTKKYKINTLRSIPPRYLKGIRSLQQAMGYKGKIAKDIYLSVVYPIIGKMFKDNSRFDAVTLDGKSSMNDT